MKEKKQYFIFGGASGIIWYSWIFVLLFLTIILTFESVNGFNWWPVVTGALFIATLVYSLLSSYYTRDKDGTTHVKLPYMKGFLTSTLKIVRENKHLIHGKFERTNFEPIAIYILKFPHKKGRN